MDSTGSVVVSIRSHDNPLLEGMQFAGRLPLDDQTVIECGRSFAWFGRGRKRRLYRIVGGCAENGIPARVVLTDGHREQVVFLSEIEVWSAPKRHPDASINLRNYGRHRRIW